MYNETWRLYSELCVPNDCTNSDIVKAYRTLAMKLHPDKEGGDPEKFKRLTAAYAVLKDTSKRNAYDRMGER